MICADAHDSLACLPGAAGVAIVIEISGAPLERDRVRKKRIYAPTCMPDSGILNLVHRQAIPASHSACQA